MGLKPEREIREKIADARPWAEKGATLDEWFAGFVYGLEWTVGDHPEEDEAVKAESHRR